MTVRSDCEYGLSSSIEFTELITSPRLVFGIMIPKICNGSIGVVSFFDSSFVSSVHIVMEWIFKSHSVVLVALLDNKSSLHWFVTSPGVGDKSGGIEESRSYNISFEVFLNSSLNHFPANDLNVVISIVFDFKLVESITVPVVALSNISVVEVVVNVVVMTKVVGLREPEIWHEINFILRYFHKSSIAYTVIQNITFLNFNSILEKTKIT